jgi:hypothetical protein
VLDEWLKRRAMGNPTSGASRTFAVTTKDRNAEDTGVRAMLVQALNDRARQFYEHYGFRASPTHPMMLMLRI